MRFSVCFYFSLRLFFVGAIDESAVFLRAWMHKFRERKDAQERRYRLKWVTGELPLRELFLRDG